MKRIVACTMVIWILCGWMIGYAVDAQTIHITNVQQFIRFAQDCRDEKYTQGKTVFLETDLDLYGYPSISIPIFGGEFDGKHHKIQGYQMQEKGSDRGLFRYIQSSGFVHNLTIVGRMEPQGTKSGIGLLAGRNAGKIQSCATEGFVKGDQSVGGLVGVNESSGIVLDCVNAAQVLGNVATGGIVGRNEGTIRNCVNQAAVNASGEQSGTHTGGIAGQSNGLIEQCTNNGMIGYPHVGYNTGGIVGIQNGQVTHCVNTGKIYGRKDVGGIVGQFEPNMETTYGASPLDVLDQSLEDLSHLMQQLADKITHTTGSAITDVDAIRDTVGNVRETVHDSSTEAIADIDAVLRQIQTQTQAAHHVLTSILADVDAFLSETNENLTSMNSQIGIARENMMQIPIEITEEIAIIAEQVDQTNAIVQGKISNIITELQGIREDFTHYQQLMQNISDILHGTGKPQEKFLQIKQCIEQLRAINPTSRLQQVQQDVLRMNESLQKLSKEIHWQIKQSNASVQEKLYETDQAFVQLEQLSSTILENTRAYQSLIFTNLQQFTGHINEITNLAYGYADQTGDKGQKTVDVVNAQLEVLHEQIGKMTQDAAQSNTELYTTATAILAQMEVVEEAAKKFVEPPEKTVDDCSTVDAQDKNGRIFSCKNTATIEADSNVGGIAGGVALELEIDPEEDTDWNATHIVTDRHTWIHATIRDCRNDGDVIVKNECAGGIVGRAEVGAILGCASRGTVQGGNQLGGIAGYSKGSIQKSAALVDLIGVDTLGGIVGQGTDIADCRAMTRINSNGEKLGAIAGAASGNVFGNYFLKESYAGIDGINYIGKSESLEFAAFSQLDGIPEDFLVFSVKFIANGEIVAEIPFLYGESIEEIPEVPKVGDVYGAWEKFETSNLHRSQTVYAVYESLETVIASPGEPSALLAEGTFSPNARLIVQNWTPKQEQIPVGYRLINAYEYTIEDDTPIPEQVKLHVWAGEHGTNVALVQNEQADVIQSTDDGSYLLCTTSNRGKVLVLQKDYAYLWIVFGISSGIILGACVFRHYKKGHKKSNMKYVEKKHIKYSSTSNRN